MSQPTEQNLVFTVALLASNDDTMVTCLDRVGVYAVANLRKPNRLAEVSQDWHLAGPRTSANNNTVALSDSKYTSKDRKTSAEQLNAHGRSSQANLS